MDRNTDQNTDQNIGEQIDQNVVQEILHELFASLEALDTQTTAIRQFLKDKGIATDQEPGLLSEAGGKCQQRPLARRPRQNRPSSFFGHKACRGRQESAATGRK